MRIAIFVIGGVAIDDTRGALGDTIYLVKPVVCRIVPLSANDADRTSSVRPSAHPSVRPFRPLNRPSAHPSVRLHPSARPSVRPSNRALNQLSDRNCLTEFC